MSENQVPPGETAPVRSPQGRQWRVGTISMGLTLVAMGALLLAGKLNLSLLRTLWPLVLIVLGLEMVLFNLVANLRGGRVRFTYDGLSIFLVLLLLLVSSGLVALETSGLLDLAHRAFRVSQHYCQGEKKTIPLEAGCRRVELKIAEGDTVLRAYDGSEISLSIVYEGYFISGEEADEYARGQAARVERVGDALSISVPAPSRTLLPNTQVRQEVTVLVPRSVNLEFEQSRGRATVIVGDLEGDWVIGPDLDELGVKLEGVTDLRVQVSIAEWGSLLGNVDWNRVPEEGADGIQAEKTWGEGSHTLLLLKDSGALRVDTR